MFDVIASFTVEIICKNRTKRTNFTINTIITKNTIYTIITILIIKKEISYVNYYEMLFFSHIFIYATIFYTDYLYKSLQMVLLIK